MNQNKKKQVLLSRLRKPVDTFTPSVGRLYRSLRDVAVAHQAIQTKYGFKLAGDPRMAAETFETQEAEVFLELLGDYDVVVDIGANIGFYSCLAASRKKSVISFEPSPRNLQHLYRNLWENGFKNTEVYPVGLGKQPGLSCLYGFGGIASFVLGWAQAEGRYHTIVPITTLDTVAAERFSGNKLLIKLDVEGFELEVLAGAQKILSMEPKPTWLVEILFKDDVIPGGTNRRYADVFDMFWSSGYRCVKAKAAKESVQQKDVYRWLHDERIGPDTTNFLFY